MHISNNIIDTGVKNIGLGLFKLMKLTNLSLDLNFYELFLIFYERYLIKSEILHYVN